MFVVLNRNIYTNKICHGTTGLIPLQLRYVEYTVCTEQFWLRAVDLTPRSNADSKSKTHRQQMATNAVCGKREPPRLLLDVDCIWNVMAHAQKPDFVFRRNETSPFQSAGRQFSRLLSVEVCASAVVMLDTPCSEVVWRVLATQSIRQFHLHFPPTSPCVITFQLDSRTVNARCTLKYVHIVHSV